MDCGIAMKNVAVSRKRCPECAAVRQAYRSSNHRYPKGKEPKVKPEKPVVEFRAKIYKMAMNPALRFIEFEDGAKGFLRVKLGHPCKVGWEVDVVPVEGPDLYHLAGRYNRWGVRCA